MKNKSFEWSTIVEMIAIGMVIGTAISFFYLVPKAVVYEKSIVCHNGELVQKEVKKDYITYERVNGTSCEERILK